MKKQFMVVKTTLPIHPDWHFQAHSRFDLRPFIAKLKNVTGVARENGLYNFGNPIYSFCFSAGELFTREEVRKNMLAALQECADIANAKEPTP